MCCAVGTPVRYACAASRGKPVQVLHGSGSLRLACVHEDRLWAPGAHPHWGLTVPRHAVAPQLHRWDPQHWLGTPQREMHLTGAGCAEQGTDCNQIRVFLKPDAG